MKILVVFDFDHTLVDDNSDTWVIRCTPDRKLPDWLESSYKKGRWTEYMGRVMSYIGDLSISPDSIRAVMETIPFTDGMIELLMYIAQCNSEIDCIIISDSNTIFIEWILQATGVQSSIAHVFTNPATINERGYMEVRCYHSHDCEQCPVNLCKRKVLEDFIESQAKAGVQYRKTFYIGDGGNDLCPVKCLKDGDVTMPRKGYSLEKLLSRFSTTDGACLPKLHIVPWTSGKEILRELNSSIKCNC